MFAMPRSMTAFGSAEGATAIGALRIEMRTVNHRFLEVSTRLPDELRSMEPAIRERIAARVSRGKLDFSVRLRADPGRQSALALNPVLLDQLAHLIDQLSAAHLNLAPPSAMQLLAWPGLVVSADTDPETLTADVLGLLDRALDSLEAQREREGSKLADVMRERALALEGLRVAATELLPQIRAGWRDKLLARLKESGASVDPQRFEQELVLVLQRMDVDEELDRLGIHLKELEKTLVRQEPVGRRLDFLSQELNREANTFGSKSTDARTSQMAVDMKVLIEQIREQVQNLE
jgi:uncharacterized protein (TIGR00255 family)